MLRAALELGSLGGNGSLVEVELGSPALSPARWRGEQRVSQ